MTSFVEKPDPARARRYLKSGEYVWNAGMLIARPERILAETREHSPEVWGALGAALETQARDGRLDGAIVGVSDRRPRLPLLF